MKTLAMSFVLSLLFASSGFATEYCYDSGVSHAYYTKQELKKCGADFDGKKFDILEKRLEHWTVHGVKSGRYQKRVVAALGDIYELYYSEIPAIAKNRENACVQKVINDFDELKAAVMDALVFCN